MRVRTVVVRVELPAVNPARAQALARSALACTAASARGTGRGRIAHIRVRVDAGAAGERALAERIGRAVAGAIALRKAG